MKPQQLYAFTPITDEIIEERAKFLFSHFTNNATRNHFELGYLDGFKACQNLLFPVEENKEVGDDHVNLKEMILAESKKGNIVISTFEGLKIAPLKEVIKQPIDGLLYDLNRCESVILTFINEAKWVNDYAMMMVVRELYNQLSTDKTDAIEWISVKERLPEFNVTVLAVDNFNKISFTCVDSSGKIDKFNLEAYHPEKAYWTHWMPLPQPPKK